MTILQKPNCVNIAPFRCRTPHHCIVTCKMIYTNSASYGSLVAGASFNSRSTSKFDVISAVAPHSSPACTQVHLMKDGILTLQKKDAHTHSNPRHACEISTPIATPPPLPPSTYPLSKNRPRKR